VSTFTGVVQRHFDKNWGNKTFYSFTLSGQDGFFNTGIKKPPATGATVEFEAEPNDKGYLEVNTKTIQYKTDGEPQSASVAKAAPKTTSEKGYWERKEAREARNDALRELGASRNTAIAVIELMLKAEAIKLPAKQADKEAVLWEVLDKYTQKLMGSSAPVDADAEIPFEAPKTSTEEEDWA